MRGLIWKDLLCLRKGIAVYAVVAAAYLLMLAAGFWDISVVASVLAVIVCVLPCSCFSYDYIAKWDRFGLALPVSRAQVVLARYLTTALLLGLSALLLAVLGLLAWALGGLDDAPVYGLTAAVTLTIGHAAQRGAAAPGLPLRRGAGPHFAAAGDRRRGAGGGDGDQSGRRAAPRPFSAAPVGAGGRRPHHRRGADGIVLFYFSCIYNKKEV